MKILIQTTYVFSNAQKNELIDTVYKYVLECFELQSQKQDFVDYQCVNILKKNITLGITIFNKELKSGLGKQNLMFMTKVSEFMKNLIKDFSDKEISVNITDQEFEEVFPESREKKSKLEEFDYEKKSESFLPVDPIYSFNRVILAENTKKRIEESLAIVQCEQKVFNEWGLFEIQPHPSSCLSFFGPSGTGKTMAAEAIAEKLGKKILKVSYADVESKYHGEGPKMVKAIFLAAEKNGAVLFFDEADSLLSKRLTNVTQGSEQAINSMRSQILICLEQFHGIVIFATNLVVNYDKAFLTRLISIEFEIPGFEERKSIWTVHIRPIADGKPHKLRIPLSDDVNINELAEKYEFVGREIRNAVVKACIKAAMNNKVQVSQINFIEACEEIEEEKKKVISAKDYTNDIKTELPEVVKDQLKKNIKAKLAESESLTSSKETE